jgi:hypothetical protein
MPRGVYKRAPGPAKKPLPSAASARPSNVRSALILLKQAAEGTVGQRCTKGELLMLLALKELQGDLK